MDLINQGLFAGILDSTPDVDVATTVVTVKLIDGLTATKSANKAVWVNGELIYTVLLTNNSGTSFTNVLFTDTLNTTLINLVINSVYLDNVPTPYTYAVNLLSVNVGDIADGESREIRFSVTRV